MLAMHTNTDILSNLPSNTSLICTSDDNTVLNSLALPAYYAEQGLCNCQVSVCVHLSCCSNGEELWHRTVQCHVCSQRMRLNLNLFTRNFIMMICVNKSSPWGQRDDMLPTDGSLTSGRSTSVRRWVHSPHISGGQPAVGSQHAGSSGSCAMQPVCYSLGWDKRADRPIALQYRLIPPLQWGA